MSSRRRRDVAMLIVKLNGSAIPVDRPRDDARTSIGGAPNQLSEWQVPYPLIDAIHSATKFITYRNIPRSEPAFHGSGEIPRCQRPRRHPAPLEKSREPAARRSTSPARRR